MMPNGPPAKLFTLNATQANPAANARDTFVIVTPPHRAPREECYHRLYSGPAEMGPMVGLSAMSPAQRICEEKSHPQSTRAPLPVAAPVRRPKLSASKAGRPWRG